MALGPSLQGWSLFRWKYVAVRIIFADHNWVMSKWDNARHGGTSPTPTLNAMELLKIPGTKFIRPTNLGTANPLSFVSFLWKPTHSSQVGWLDLVNTDSIGWKSVELFRLYFAAFDPSVTDTLTWNGECSLTMKFFAVYQVGQWIYTQGAQPTLKIEERNANMISTEVQMHKDGLTDCIDLTMLENEPDCVIIDE